VRDGPARRHMRARRPDQRRPFSQVPVVVDFTATWCGPCQRIKPFFEELAAAHKGALFVKVDVDELESVSQAAEVLAMPTFQVYREGRRVDTVQGAATDARRLRAPPPPQTPPAPRGRASLPTRWCRSHPRVSEQPALADDRRANGSAQGDGRVCGRSVTTAGGATGASVDRWGSKGCGACLHCYTIRGVLLTRLWAVRAPLRRLAGARSEARTEGILVVSVPVCRISEPAVGDSVLRVRRRRSARRATFSSETIFVFLCVLKSILAVATLVYTCVSCVSASARQSRAQ
jgi:thioredoxin 1